MSKKVLTPDDLLIKSREEIKRLNSELDDAYKKHNQLKEAIDVREFTLKTAIVVSHVLYIIIILILIK